MSSRALPKYKTKYRVANWSSYDRALIRRGDITVWLSPEAIAAWSPTNAGKRGWKKLHLGLDEAGVIVAQVLTDANANDAATAPVLIAAIEGDISSFTGDAAYDTIAVYDAAGARGARVVVPPVKTAVVSRRRPRSTARDRTIRRVKKIGRRRWKKESDHGRQGTVENAFFRYKSIIGDWLRARHPGARETEALLGCNVLNRMLELGRPVSRAISA